MNLRYTSIPFIVGVFLILSIAIPIHTTTFGKIKQKRDLYFIYTECSKLATGENPYLRTLEGDMRNNEKYPTYLPLFYGLGALTIVLGLDSFLSFQILWQSVSLIALISIAALLFHMLAARGQILLAVFGALFFVFNRWTLWVSHIGQIDFLAILFLVLSFHYRDRDFTKSLLLYGLSLSIKQIGILVFPLFLIWSWRRHEKPRELVKTAVIAGSVPFLISLPFLIWNPRGFVYSVLFSLTRVPKTSMRADSIGEMIYQLGLPAAHLPMLAMLCLVFVLAYRRILGPAMAMLLVFVCWVDFNNVLFNQYFVWLVPWFPLAVTDFSRGGGRPFTRDPEPE